VLLRRTAQLGTSGCLKSVGASAEAAEGGQVAAAAAAAGRALSLIERGCGWLRSISDLQQLQELRPTANHLGTVRRRARRRSLCLLSDWDSPMPRACSRRRN
jgi:hypothetical protein